MSYFEQSDLEALIPPDFLTQSLDDDGDGVIDAFESVRTKAQDKVDGSLESRFTVPFDPVPKKIKEAATVFAAALCYRRRGTADKENPWAEEEAKWMKKLATIEAGDLGLSVAPTAQEPANAAGEVFTWDSELGEPGRLLG